MVPRCGLEARAVTLDEAIGRHDLRRAGAPPSRAKGVVLLIHGRGATAESMLPLADVIAMPDLCYLAPQAAGHTWYPQSFMAPTAANEPYLSAALARISLSRIFGSVASALRLSSYDEPEILPSSSRPICLMSADAGHSSLCCFPFRIEHPEPTARGEQRQPHWEFLHRPGHPRSEATILT